MDSEMNVSPLRIERGAMMTIKQGKSMMNETKLLIQELEGRDRTYQQKMEDVREKVRQDVYFYVPIRWEVKSRISTSSIISFASNNPTLCACNK